MRARLLRWLPTRAELWTFHLGAGVPFVLLAAFRLIIAHGLGEPMRWTDAVRIHYGELEYATLWAWGWWLGYRVVGRILPRLVRALFFTLTATIALVEALDLAYFQTTGNRSDLDMLMVGFAEVDRFLPVVLSEMHAGRWLTLAAFLLLCVSPAFLRGRDAPGGRWVWLAALPWLLVADMEIRGRDRPRKVFKPLQRGLVEILFYDWLDRETDAPIAPVPKADATTGDALDVQMVHAAPLVDADHPNVVVVVLESIGAAATTPYAPDLPTTPNLARWASEGLRVDTMTAVVPHTSKALVTTLCGDWPALYAEVTEATPGGLPGRCLPELAHDLGYRAAFFQTANAEFEDRGSLVHYMGFDHVRTRETLQDGTWDENNYFGIDDRAFVGPSVAWAREQAQAGQPFAAVYLTLASHHDYSIPAGIAPREWAGVTGRRAAYYDAVHFVDGVLGELVKAYDDAGLADHTVFVFLGDHGEAFGEHGRSQHDLVIYEEGLRVPMIVWAPWRGLRGTVAGDRQQIDVLPTLIELMGGVVRDGAFRGLSLLHPQPDDRVLYHSCWRRGRCLARRERADKFVELFRDGGPQRFDLATDPGERESTFEQASTEEQAALPAEVRRWRNRVMGRYAELFERWKASAMRPDDTRAPYTWGEAISMLSCAPQRREVLAGESVWLRCRWRAERSIGDAVRVHLSVRSGDLVHEVRWNPGYGNLPAWEWPPGWAVDDEPRVILPPDFPAGDAEVEVGFATFAGRPWRIADGSALAPAGRIHVTAVLQPGATVIPREGPSTGEPDVDVRAPPAPPPELLPGAPP